MATSTPDGTVMGSLPIRDISRFLPGPWSPDVGENFSAYALVVGLTIGQQALRRGDDRHAEPAEDLGQSGRLRVHPQTRLADATHPGDRALSAGAGVDGHAL